MYIYSKTSTVHFYKWNSLELNEFTFQFTPAFTKGLMVNGLNLFPAALKLSQHLQPITTETTCQWNVQILTRQYRHPADVQYCELDLTREQMPMFFYIHQVT